MTDYTNLEEINGLQKEIMTFVAFWVKEKKTPVPQKEIVAFMFQKKKTSPNTVVYELQILLKKGYLRRAYTTMGNTRSYVQLRTVSQ